ncbi:unnamed protein product [Closterium sp. NIES-64]|nr:unnamed protein product [Closterium sp. NIES-64]
MPGAGSCGPAATAGPAELLSCCVARPTELLDPSSLDLQLYLQCDSVDDISLFDFASGAVPAPPADADPTVRSKWAHTRCCCTSCCASPPPFLPSVPTLVSAKTAQALYDASLTSLPTFALVTLATELRFLLPFLAENPPPMYITLYFLVTQSVGAASAPSGRRRSGRSKGGKGAGGASGAVAEEVGAAGSGGGGGGGGGSGGTGGGSGGGPVAADGGGGGGSGSGGGEGWRWRRWAAEAEVAVVEVVGVARPSGAALGVVSASNASRDVPAPQQLVSGTRSVSVVGRSVPAPTSFAPATARVSDEGDCYRCFPPDPGIGTAASGASEAAALGASASVLSVLPCPAAPSGTLTGLYLPSFSTNLVSGADLQDVGVHQFTPARQRVTHCTEASTGRHLATFTRQQGRAWRQRAAPHSSQFPPTEAPLQTLHMDVWGPARVPWTGSRALLPVGG